MEWNKRQDERIALIAELCKRAPTGTLGRTAIMKLCYFLQTLREVPLGYHFTLYSYGPFDSNVLADLGTAESLGAVRSSIRYYTGGYGYDIRKAEEGDAVIESARDFLESQRDSVNWVISEFSGLSSGVLELQSTLVFADREAASKSERPALPELARRVKEIKPHFTEDFILEQAQTLFDKQFLVATTPATACSIGRSAA